jgi:hypothetical protein
MSVLSSAYMRKALPKQFVENFSYGSEFGSSFKCIMVQATAKFPTKGHDDFKTMLDSSIETGAFGG